MIDGATKWTLPIVLAFAASCASQRGGVTRDFPLGERPPNFILINCDDLGYADIGCFGSTVHRTPNIDRIAAEGMKLTSHMVTSGVCTPSRSSLLTGCYPRRVNMHQNVHGEWVLFPIDEKGLNPTEVTIAEILRDAGYATACVGKWHLGDQAPFLPTRQGFDTYFGIPYSNDMGAKQRRPKQNPPLPLMRGETVIEAPVEQATLTGRYTDEAIAFIEANRDRPFFLYLPHTFPHVPLFASEAFAGRSANGKYGDAVEELDHSTGRILDKLAELGLAEDTVVVFTSDNGAAQRPGGSNAPLRGFKGSTWEGGMRVCFSIRWPGKIAAGSVRNDLTTSMDLLPSFARLAGASVPSDRVLDGKDVTALWLNAEGATSPHGEFYYYFKDQLQAVRAGRWKLHLPRGKGDKAVVGQLYDLEDDVAESIDLVAEHPKVVAHLEEIAERARAELGDRGREGSGTRPAGIVEEPVPLTLDSEADSVGG